MDLYQCLFCGGVFDRSELDEMEERGKEFYYNGGDFVCPDCLDKIKTLNLPADTDSVLPDTYAEIEYNDFDNPEAIDGARWDDMNYRYYTER